MESLDLTLHAPRSPYETLDGLCMLPRTIDKLRAELPGGKSGEYHYAGFSETLIEDLEIDVEALRACVREAKDDAEVAAWVRAHAKHRAYDEINSAMLAKTLNADNRERLTKKYPVVLDHPEVERLFDMIVLDDARNFGDASVRSNPA